MWFIELHESKILKFDGCIYPLRAFLCPVRVLKNKYGRLAFEYSCFLFEIFTVI